MSNTAEKDTLPRGMLGFLRELLGEPVAEQVMGLLLQGDRSADDFEPAIQAALAAPQLEVRYKLKSTSNIGKHGRLLQDFKYVGLDLPTPGWHFSKLFDTLFAERLGKREHGFREIFSILGREHDEPPLIVETGCLRVPGNWEGDGQSTFMFDAFAQANQGTCMTVDINFQSVDTARRACSSHTNIVLNDSVSFLHSYANTSPVKKIDLLYLDSYDLDRRAPLPAAIHHMKELLAAWPMLRRGSIVCVDDFAVGDGGGKGGIIDDFFANAGCKELFSDYQKAWIVS